MFLSNIFKETIHFQYAGAIKLSTQKKKIPPNQKRIAYD